MNITGAEWIVRFLERQGVPLAVVDGGRAVEPLRRALAVSTRDESPSPRPSPRGERENDAVCALVLSATAQERQRLIELLRKARADAVSLLCIAGQLPRACIDSAAFGAGEGPAAAAAKAWFHVGAAYELLELLPEALRIASSGWPGPVVLEIPQDVQAERIWGVPRPRPAPRLAAPAVTTFTSAQECLHG